MCVNNRIIIFCSLLDIWENVLLDIRENVEWPHFFWPTLYAHFILCNFTSVHCPRIQILSSLVHSIMHFASWNNEITHNALCHLVL